MRRFVRQLVPSMFQRRLVLVATVVVIVTIILVLRLAQLTVVQGMIWQGRAESALVRWSLIHTERGRILDRQGRVLAEDRPSYDLVINYPVITGRWAADRAESTARETTENRRRPWHELSDLERLTRTEQVRMAFDTQVDRFWAELCDLGRIDRPQLDQRLDTIRRRVQRMVHVVQSARYRKWHDELGDPRLEAQITQPIVEQEASHAVLNDLDDDARWEAERLIARAAADRHPADDVWSQVKVIPSKKRHYPHETMTLNIDCRTLPRQIQSNRDKRVTVGGVGMHLVGALRSSSAEERKRPFGVDDLKGYLPGDEAGEWGLERGSELTLRGTRGRITRRLDTGERQRQAAVSGGDVTCTVDIRLQARIQALMDPAFGLMQVQAWHGARAQTMLGTPLRGAAVVLDIGSSEVLAAVSEPTFTREQWGRDRSEVEQDSIQRPFWNRAVAMPYQPGSTVKPLVLTAAVTDRRIAHDEKIECRGHLFEETPGKYRCWIYNLYYPQTHQWLHAPAAIMHSCNIFFYSLGDRLGAARLVHWYEQFGLGHRSGCGLVEESTGKLPGSEALRTGMGRAESVFMGIGQGPVEWTPLQAAGAYAALARGGYWVPPTFLLEATASPSVPHRDLNLDPHGVAMAMKGLWMAVNDSSGTVHHFGRGDDREIIFNVEGVTIYGKSGTATVRRFVDGNGNGRIDKQEHWFDINHNGQRDDGELVPQEDHAWCILVVEPSSMSGSQKLRADVGYVVAVVVEYGGSGGRVAGPIANQILHALRTEGYL